MKALLALSETWPTPAHQLTWEQACRPTALFWRTATPHVGPAHPTHCLRANILNSHLPNEERGPRSRKVAPDVWA